MDCKDQETDYPRWIVETWERLLDEHFRRIKNPEDVFVSRELWFGTLPAVMRIRITTPNVMKALRKRDPGAAKPYNFALSPLLIEPPPDCMLVAPFSKQPDKWLTRDYTEIHSGDTVNLMADYKGAKDCHLKRFLASFGGTTHTQKINPFHLTESIAVLIREDFC